MVATAAMPCPKCGELVPVHEWKKHKCRIICSHCGSKNTISYGDFIKTGKKITRCRKCLDCNKAFKETR